jgi:uncharacterized membrane protein YbaN (DUF454 family)
MADASVLDGMFEESNYVSSETKLPVEKCPVMSRLQGAETKLAVPASQTGVVAAAVEASDRPGIGSLKRLTLLVSGLLLVVVAAAGVVLPGIPTAGPLILASICLTKSCPWLEQRLVRSRFFAPFHCYLDGSAQMPRKARWAAAIMMWIAILCSATVLSVSGTGSVWLVTAIVLSGVAGTFAIARYGRR